MANKWGLLGYYNHVSKSWDDFFQAFGRHGMLKNDGTCIDL